MLTYEEYRWALEGASEELKERILEQADRDGAISFPEVLRLRGIAFPEFA